ncbi:hypothetical protein AWH48_15925 [Domibacillus aminovorans]|uniref:Uncharacterized protein n=1 Tax=Domibacillus aminovorans TaxID=29332 RepID=A0A177L0N2_9BACI|nr:hypothetical protein AWH48_15925 [Domibacillus aminovorans]
MFIYSVPVFGLLPKSATIPPIQLFWREDELIQELMLVGKIGSDVQEGDLMRIELSPDDVKDELL